MSSIDEQFIDFIVRSLVGKPDEVKIQRTIDEKGVLLELTVDPEDLGRVIGKRGVTAQSMRTLLRALGTKNDARYNLKIIDNGVGREERQENRATSDETPADSQKVETKTETKSAKEEQIEEKVEAKPEPEPAPEIEEAAQEEESLADKTRKELSELDDLDI